MVKKLNPIKVQEELLKKNFSLFSPREFQRIFNVSSSAASKFINSYVQKKFFVKLKNGLYALKQSRPSDFVIANKLYQPSYLSLESALSFYGLIPETVYSITSVSTRATREFTVLDKSFTYTRLKKNVFTGYYSTKQNNETFLIAEPQKALLDYFYLVSLGRKILNERLNLQGIKKSELQKWSKIFSSPRLNLFINKIYDNIKTN